MPGFDNEVVYGGNVDFSGTNRNKGTAQITQDGMILIGKAVGPQGVPSIDAGFLTSTGGTIVVTNGPGTINIETQFDTLKFNGNTGQAAPVSGILNVTANTVQGITVTGSGNTLAITAFNATTAVKGVASFNPADFTVTNGAVSLISNPGTDWTVVTASTDNLVTHTGYFANNATSVTFTLPATASVGDSFQVVAMHATGTFIIAQNASQSIQVGNVVTTTGVGGSLTSTDIGDWIEIVCSIQDVGFFCNVKQGNIDHV